MVRVWKPKSIGKATLTTPWNLQATSRRGRHLRPLRRRHGKAFISLRRDVVADLAVDSDAADIGHEDLRLARDVGAHVPGVRLRIERRGGNLVDMRDPVVLGIPVRL